jgi:hypothetical protein
MHAVRSGRILLEVCYCHCGQILILIQNSSLPFCTLEVFNTMIIVYKNRTGRKQGARGSNVGFLNILALAMCKRD